MGNNKIYLTVDSCGYIFYYHWMHDEYKGKFVEKIEDRHFQSNCDCGRKLDYSYLYIIYCLKEADLLYKSYEVMCCFCHLLACVGLEIPEEWEDVIILWTQSKLRGRMRDEANIKSAGVLRQEALDEIAAKVRADHAGIQSEIDFGTNRFQEAHEHMIEEFGHTQSYGGYGA